MSLSTMTSESDALYSLETFNVTLATTINDVISNTTSPTAADVIRTVAFLLFVITGFTLNCIQISVILQTRQLRVDRFNILLISLATVNLVDCLGNIPSTALDSHSRNDLWDSDNTLYTIDCIIVYLVGMVTLLGLLFMVADRLAEFRGSLGLSRHCPAALTPLACARIMAVYSWIHGTILAVPFSLPALASGGCPGHACQGRLAYLWTMALIGFVVPVIILCCLYGYVICTAVQQGAQCQAYTSEHASEPRSACLPDLGDFKYLAWLTVTWFVFQAPLLVWRFIVLAGRSSKRPDESVPGASFELGVALRWLFVAYALLLPLLTFCRRRDARQKWARILSCHKTNIVVDSSPGHRVHQPSVSPSLQRNSFAVPVLFATANGLHVQMHHDQVTTKGTSPGASPTVGRTQLWVSSPEKKRPVLSETTPSKRCDVFGSFHSGDILSDDGTTSECESSYDCNFFILQSNNPTTKTTTSYNDDYRTTSTGNKKKAAASLEKSENSRASGLGADCSSSILTVDKLSPLQAPRVAPDVDDRTKQQKIEMRCLDPDAATSPEKRCSSDSGRGSVETAIKGNEHRLSTQGKQNTGAVWHSTEATHSSELHQSAATSDPNDQEQLSRTQNRKKRNQRKNKNSEHITSDGNAEVADSNDAAVVVNTQRQKTRGERRDQNSVSEPAAVEQPHRITDFQGETNNNELKTTKVKRNRQTSESNNNLLDSSNTSSEFAMLQSTYH